MWSIQLVLFLYALPILFLKGNSTDSEYLTDSAFLWLEKMSICFNHSIIYTRPIPWNNLI